MSINVTRSSMPSFEEYCEEIRELWDSHWLTNMGCKHQRLEEELKHYLGCEQLALFTNGHLALENVWNRFLISPMEWKLFLDQFKSERVGMYFDAANCCLNCRPEDFPEILGGYIKAVHLKNFEESDSAGGLHGFGDDLFKGVVDFKKLFAAFAKIGYAGPFTVEMIPFSRLPDLVMPDAALAEKMVGQIKELKALSANK